MSFRSAFFLSFYKILNLPKRSKIVHRNTIVLCYQDELARVLVTLFDSRHLLYQLLWNMFSKEVELADSMQTLFRGNSLASKIMTFCFKVGVIDFVCTRALGLLRRNLETVWRDYVLNVGCVAVAIGLTVCFFRCMVLLTYKSSWTLYYESSSHLRIGNMLALKWILPGLSSCHSCSLTPPQYCMRSPLSHVPVLGFLVVFMKTICHCVAQPVLKPVLFLTWLTLLGL
jgi:hypothetical protein